MAFLAVTRESSKTKIKPIGIFDSISTDVKSVKLLS